MRMVRRQPGVAQRPATPSRRYTSIERAETWLHFTSAPPPLALLGDDDVYTVDARSIASVRPTGPPPTITTCPLNSSTGHP